MAVLLNPKFWIAVALSALLAFTHFASYRAGKASVRHDFDAFKLAQAESRILADRAQTLATTKALNDAHAQTVAADAAAASAGDAASRLRNRLAAYVKAHPAGSGKGVEGSDPIGVFAELLNRHDDALQRVSSYADRLKIAGLACEAISDGETEKK